MGVEREKVTDLINRAVKGDKEAFVRLIDRHRQCMYATAMAVLHQEDDALDAIQDTILTVWLKLPTLRNTGYFKTWMTKVLVNTCCTQLRKKSREIAAEEIEEAARDTDVETAMDVKEVLKKLTEDDRLILQLFYYEDLSVHQIADILSLKPGAVKMRLARSRQRFLEQYTKEARYEKY